MTRVCALMALSAVSVGCLTVDPASTCEQTGIDASEVSGEVLMTRIRVECGIEDQVTYLLALEQQEDFGPASSAEMILVQADSGSCSSQETRSFTALADDPSFTMEHVATLPVGTEPSSIALYCDASSTFLVLLYDESGGLSDCAVWGGYPEHFLDDADYSACHDWTPEVDE